MIWHILTPVLLAGAMNSLIYFLGWNRNSSSMKSRGLLPPGYVIGIIWILLLGLLGYVHYLVYPSPVHWVVIGTILYCISYPVLTAGLRGERAPLFNMLALLAATLTSFAVLFIGQKKAFFLTIPLFAWAFYVNLADTLGNSKIL